MISYEIYNAWQQAQAQATQFQTETRWKTVDIIHTYTTKLLQNSDNSNKYGVKNSIKLIASCQQYVPQSLYITILEN